MYVCLDVCLFVLAMSGKHLTAVNKYVCRYVCVAASRDLISFGVQKVNFVA